MKLPRIQVSSGIDMTYIELVDSIYHRTEVHYEDGYNLDYDAAGNLIGVELFTATIDWVPATTPLCNSEEPIEWPDSQV